MAQEYRLVGSQDPGSRIDSVRVEDPSEEFPDGKTLELNGEPVALGDEQVARLSGFVRLEQVSEEEGGAEAAEYTAEAYPDEQESSEQAPEQSADQPAAAQPAPEDAQPEPQPEAQQVARPRARREG